MEKENRMEFLRLILVLWVKHGSRKVQINTSNHMPCQIIVCLMIVFTMIVDFRFSIIGGSRNYEMNTSFTYCMCKNAFTGVKMSFSYFTRRKVTLFWKRLLSMVQLKFGWMSECGVLVLIAVQTLCMASLRCCSCGFYFILFFFW